MAVFSLLFMASAAMAAPAADKVDQLPGFDKTPFDVYSGYLDVKGPVAGYDALKIHYQLHLSQRSPSKDPIVTWHQGGPGGSAMFGLYTEMGYFQLSDQGQFANDNAWNKVANMLYLESPAGSSVSIGGPNIGFSSCYKGGEKLKTCSWNDTSQAEAYAKTLVAFFEKFPEYKSNDLYLTGESYAGQYLPNIANYILREMPKGTLNLKGLALGNSCWGGDKDTVTCNGPNSDQNDVELYFGKGLISTQLRSEIYKACSFPNPTANGEAIGIECRASLLKMDEAVGPHNVYDIYDDCPGAANMIQNEGRSMSWFRRVLRNNMHKANPFEGQLRNEPDGGYDWSCGGEQATPKYFQRQDVLEALNLNVTGSGFSYDTSGPASITLYPFLAQNLRMLVYSGDSDSCVPYKGTEESINMLESQGILSQTSAWRPWYAGDKQNSIPAGYATSYKAQGASDDLDFTFLTIRLAGHMVPTFRPKASLVFFQRFLDKQPF